MKAKLVIFSGLSNFENITSVSSEFDDSLSNLGNQLDTKKYEIWYCDGKNNSGLITNSFFKNNGNVSILRSLDKICKSDNSYHQVFELDNDSDCQKKLIEIGDIFLYLPGGLGTISEIFEVFSNSSIANKNIMILLYSYDNYYKEFISFIVQNIHNGNLSSQVFNNLYIFNEANEILEFLNKLYFE